jgi:hypothetical protein
VAGNWAERREFEEKFPWGSALCEVREKCRNMTAALLCDCSILAASRRFDPGEVRLRPTRVSVESGTGLA